MTGLWATVVLLCLLILLGSLIVLFFRNWRPKAKWVAVASAIGLVVSFTLFGLQTDKQAREMGFLSAADQRSAEQAGVTDASVWQLRRSQAKAAEAADAEAAQAKVAEAEAAVVEAAKAAKVAKAEPPPRHPLSLDEIHLCEKIWVINRQAGADLNDRAPDFCKEFSDRLDEAPKKAHADQQHPPPDGFRGIEWNSGILSFQRLRDTVFKGCDTMVPQKNIVDKPPYSYLHINTDDIDVFIQRRNVAAIFGVPASEQMLTWSYRKFWQGQVFIYNYKENDLGKLRAALIDQYGPPTLDDTKNYWTTEWRWPDENIAIMLKFDPVPKSKGAGSNALQTSISLLFTQTE
jgi:hypothetical protein